MKAIVQNNYGSPEVLAFKEVDKPAIKEDEVLVRVHARFPQRRRLFHHARQSVACALFGRVS